MGRGRRAFPGERVDKRVVRVMKISGFLLGLLALLMVGPALAQDQAWLQIEAQPDLNTATDRARAYASVFPQVEGYHLQSGWYGIALGPFTSDQAVQQLQSLMAQNMIPSDSYISDGSTFGDQFWPVGGQTTPAAKPLAAVDPVTQAPLAQAPATDIPAAEVPATSVPAAEVPAAETTPVLSEETVKEAKAGEAALDAAGRQDLQAALKWYGFYEGKVDGNIGSGTRGSMAKWQEAQGFDPTGVLTTSQRKGLVDGYKGEEAAFGFATVSEPESAIEITLPLAMVQFDRYTPPFVRYGEKDGSGVTAMLISEPGTTASLAGLYDVLQSLEIVPSKGERSLDETSFTIKGRNDQIETLAYAEIVGSNVKGYLLSWNVAQSDQMRRVLPIVQSSFRSSGDKAMDPGLVPLDAAVKRGLLDGLAVKKPKLSRSGFFIDARGAVLTTLEAVDQCGSITLERSVSARVSFEDKTLGIAVLTPDVALSPKVVAEFAAAAPGVGAAVAVSGYSYEDRLPAPVLTRGTLEEGQGLNGEAGLSRLSLQALPGDAGGPVLDASGAVVGMLLPAGAASARELPPGVAFAASAAALTGVLTNPGGPALTLNAETTTGKATPDAFNKAARGMTVLVSCWP